MIKPSVPSLIFLISTQESQLDAAMDLMRRLPPRHVQTQLAQLTQLVPHLTEDLLASIDQPLLSKKCITSNRDYLVCDYNRDGDSYRSPWSNLYDPPLSDGTVPSTSLRKLEQSANAAFDTYRELYYEGGTSSVYMWDLDNGFASAILIKKSSDMHSTQATWDSIHIFEVIERPNHTAHYKLTSTVILSFLNGNKTLDGSTDLCGSITRQQENDFSFQEADITSHLPNLGRMVEEMEFKLRDVLKNVYFDKTRDIVNEIRSTHDLNQRDRRQSATAVQSELFAKLAARRAQ